MVTLSFYGHHRKYEIPQVEASLLKFPDDARECQGPLFPWVE